jgi:CBS domain-containing protein
MTEATLTPPSRSRGLGDFKVAEVMHPGVLTCRVDAPLSDVARTMVIHRVHCVVVLGLDDELDTDLEGRLWGVVSDLDLVSAAVLDDFDLQIAGSAAVTPAVLVSPEDTLAHAVQLMSEHGISHLVVANPSSLYPAGVLSTLDVARVLF